MEKLTEFCCTPTMRTIAMKRLVAFAVLAMSVSVPAIAAEHYCTYFGGVSSDRPDARQYVPEKPLEQLVRDGCKKGDALRIVIYDHGSAGVKGREIVFLSEEITELCDLSRPVTIVGTVAQGSIESGAHHAVCTYAGARRSLRRSE